MEGNGKEVRQADPEENQFLVTIHRTGVPRILVASILAFVRYCADQLPKKMTLGYLRILAAVLVIVMPRSLTYVLLYPIFRLVFGNLYPAYASYKAVRTKNVKEYVKWMMYWIVFALFTCAETFTDVFFSFWFPFYYEIKTILVVWLLSPATKGSSILYRRFVHPALIRREAEIDEALARATEQGYTAVLHLGSKGVNYATTVLMQTAIKGGGGLVQHLKKSYSLSDLTGEKEDENRNTPHMHDETDMQVEPRRREHVGRRGYSPRRTQSSSNRVDMYFSEVDVDVRQPRSREPTTSLTNIRSSDDISSGYSSGEALQSSRTSHGDSSLVRTSSVGARTRTKPRSATKKTPEDSGEDCDSIDHPSSKNISLPTPLNLLTPEQALEILLLLSQNSNVADSIELDRGSFVTVNDDVLKNTSQSGPRSSESDATSTDSALTAEVQIIESIEMKTVPEPSSKPGNDDEVRKDERETKQTENATNSDTSASDRICPMVVEESSKESTQTVTDELCRNKFDELKQLLSDAHKAVNNIVHTQEKLRSSDGSLTETLSQGDLARSVDSKETNETKIKENESGVSESVEQLPETSNELKVAVVDVAIAGPILKTSNVASLDVWPTPNVSRSNSDSLERAGKYKKRPAPKVPLTKSEEELHDDDSQSALKATLVIKTGTLKTFANTSATKDVFIGHDIKTKGKKSKKQRTKEGFSKLLTIPKNIFHSAFYKEPRGSGKQEDSSSDISSQVSRSNSMEPQESIIELAPKLSNSGQEMYTENDDKSENDTSNSLDSYVLAPNDNGESIEREVGKMEKEKHIGTTGEGKTVATSFESEIKEMSQSPKAGRKLESDIF